MPLFRKDPFGRAWVLLSLVILYLVSREERYSRLGKSVARFNVILFSAGATFGFTKIAGLLLAL